jgi:hypothetical protein
MITCCWSLFFLFAKILFIVDTNMLSCYTAFVCITYGWASTVVMICSFSNW